MKLNEPNATDEILGRLELLQTIRPKPPTFWQQYGRRPAVAFGTVILIASLEKSGMPIWMVCAGVGLLVLGLITRRDDSSDRLDALVQLLEQNGHLAAAQVAHHVDHQRGLLPQPDATD